MIVENSDELVMDNDNLSDEEGEENEMEGFHETTDEDEEEDGDEESEDEEDEEEEEEEDADDDDDDDNAKNDW